MLTKPCSAYQIIKNENAVQGEVEMYRGQREYISMHICYHRNSFYLDY